MHSYDHDQPLRSLNPSPTVFSIRRLLGSTYRELITGTLQLMTSVLISQRGSDK